MKLQTETIAMESEIISEDQHKAKTASSTNNTNAKVQPCETKDLWGRKKGIDYSKTSYWQKASHCTVL